MKIKKWAGIFVCALCVLIVAAVCIVFTAGAGYTVLIGDDFTHGVRVGAFHVPFWNYFAASLLYVKDLYMDWQGTWFSMFLQAFLSPVNNFGLPQLRAVMVGNAILFFISLILLLWVAFSFFSTGEGREKDAAFIPLRFVMITLVFLTVINADVYAEIYFWFSGAVAYSMPFSILLVSLTLLLLINKEETGNRKKKIYTVCAAFLLFLSGGGSLAVAGTGCYAALLLVLGFTLLRRKNSRCNAAVFASGFAGALINAAAPGNFSRHDKTAGGSLHFVQAIVSTVRMFAEETGRLFKETLLGLIFLVLIAAGVYLAGKCKIALREYGVVTILALAVGLVADFPVALGYGGSYVPNRCYFIIDTTLVLSLLNLALFIGVCLHRLWGLPSDGKSLSMMLYICLAVVIVSPLKIEETPFYRVARRVYNGTYCEYYGECVKIYEYLETCPEEDVAVAVPDEIEDFACFYLDTDADGWVNVGMAEYYGKTSIRWEDD